MRLIYSKGACSLSVHIMFEELGIPYEREAVSLKDKAKLELISPKSYVPLLVFENGEVMSEASCILQYLAEKEKRLDLIGGAPGTLEKFRCIEWLDFVSTEIHKAVGPLFRSDLDENYRNDVIRKTESRLELINDQLSEKTFLTGEQITIADMYCITNLHILEYLKFDLNQFSNIMRYMHMMDVIPSVKRAMEQENEDLPHRKHHHRPLNEGEVTNI
jgi:glutathione S-transferase